MCVGRVRVNLKNFPLYMYHTGGCPHSLKWIKRKQNVRDERLGDEAESKEYQY